MDPLPGIQHYVPGTNAKRKQQERLSSLIFRLLNIIQVSLNMSDACCCFVCVRTQEVGVVEDLGQFKQLLDPGLHCITWPLQNIVGRMSLRIQQLDVLCETKTKDNVFVQVGVAVQYRVLVDGGTCRVILFFMLHTSSRLSRHVE